MHCVYCGISQPENDEAICCFNCGRPLPDVQRIKIEKAETTQESTGRLKKAKIEELTDQDFDEISRILSDEAAENHNQLTSYPVTSKQQRELMLLNPEDLPLWLKRHKFSFVELGHVVFDEKKNKWVKKGRLIDTDKGFKVIMDAD